MTLAQISSLGRLLTAFLVLFADCFAGTKGRALFRVFVCGLLSNVQRKNVEAIALRVRASVRTLQRFLESIKWNEQRVIDRCQQLIAAEHADPEAIGLIDETGVAKSGPHTVGAQRQYNGNRGKIENAVVHVGLGYSTGNFHALLDARVYLPEDWANDPARRKKRTSPTTSVFKRNHRSRWTCWTAPWATASASRLGRSTNFTVATVRFWMGSTHVGKPSSARFPPTFGCGWTRPAWSVIRRRNPACGGERDWSADGGRRKCVISADTHPPSTINVRNAIASRTLSRGPTSGRFNGTRVGVGLKTNDS
jgi:hypothetical protein